MAWITCSRHFQVGESDGKVRQYSFLAAGQMDAVKSSSQLNLKHTFSLTHRYESTSTASAASAAPPVEKYEYQAEACSLNKKLYTNLEFKSWCLYSPFTFYICVFFLHGRWVVWWTSLSTACTATKRFFFVSL